MTVPHERTPTGRVLLRLKRTLSEWVQRNRESAPPADIQAAAILMCDLHDAAHNGVTGDREALLKNSINKMFVIDANLRR